MRPRQAETLIRLVWVAIAVVWSFALAVILAALTGCTWVDCAHTYTTADGETVTDTWTTPAHPDPCGGVPESESCICW